MIGVERRKRQNRMVMGIRLSVCLLFCLAVSPWLVSAQYIVASPGVTPATATYGSSVTVTCFVRNSYNGLPVQNQFVTFTATGASGSSIGYGSTNSFGVASWTANALSAGSYTIQCSASGVTSTSSYFTITKAATTVSWAAPAPINYGTALSTAQLNATASVPGTFAYSPAAGSTPPVGTDTLSVTFTPSNSTNYSTSTASVSLLVNPAPAPLQNQVYQFNGSYDGVGNLTGYSDTVMGTWSMTAPGGGSGYDSLNRLMAANATWPNGTTQSFCWQYDSFGNRIQQESSPSAFTSGGGATPCQTSSTVSTVLNNYTNSQGRSQGPIKFKAPTPAESRQIQDTMRPAI